MNVDFCAKVVSCGINKNGVFPSENAENLQISAVNELGRIFDFFVSKFFVTVVLLARHTA